MANDTNKERARLVGEQGEQAVAEWYEQAGWCIVERNWRCFEGEIDLIARRDRMFVFCEVKSRSSADFRDPALAVDFRKQAKLRTAAFRWLEGRRPSGQIRFDVALVVGGTIQILEDAF